MPQNKGPEIPAVKPKQEMLQGLPASDHEGEKLLPPAENESGEQPHQSLDTDQNTPEQRERGVDPMFERAVEGIEAAAPGAVVLIGGLSASRDPGKSSRISGTVHQQKEYGARLRDEAFKDRTDVHVITRRDLAGSGDERERILDAMRDARAANGDAKIVIDAPLFLKDIMLGAWGGDADALKGPMAMEGRGSRAWLEHWLEESASEKSGDDSLALPPAQVQENLRHVFDNLRTFINSPRGLNGGPLSFGIAADDPISIAFLVFAAQEGQIDQSAIRVALASFSESRDAVGFVHIEHGDITVSIGDKTFGSRKLRNLAA